MRIFKTRPFHRWAIDIKLADEALSSAVDEMERGLIDVNLGGHVYKKRVALKGRGKSGGVRTIIAYRIEDKAFFVYGFAKNARANISSDELKAFKKLANELLSHRDAVLDKAIKEGKFFEVITNE
ncbi:MAG: type II toxin-antitoxin system RelE/ParE family toxin [Ectothiorhodospiraceae bacterium]|nr:type II toxin-antitoxin system RelE/ParE family toxin [Ectothiorhodospiraceae bacterium]